jgi:glycosyltransferase involved in cell wall biosynthesis
MEARNEAVMLPGTIMNVKVSVLMTTFNHERFIAKALDSILMQKTNFPFEIVIGEDCSTDNTRNILLDYHARYPGIFRLQLNDRNLGGLANGRQALEKCQGKYIASLDGDDYWTSPYKLQKQVDLLDNHPEFSSCYHDVLIIHEDGSREPTHYRPRQKEFSTVDDLLLDNFIPTSSIMFRNGIFGRLPAWIDSLKIADWAIHILNAQIGPVGYIDDLMAVYVVHPGGVWSMKSWQEHAIPIAELFEALEKHIDRRYSGSIRRILRWRYFTIAEKYEYLDDYSGARKHAVKCLSKHLFITGEIARINAGRGSSSIDSLPDEIVSVTGTSIARLLLRLYVAPAMRLHVPTLYRFIRQFVA